MPTPPRTPASDLIGWSLERDGPLHKGGGFYHRSVKPAIDPDGNTLTVLVVLAKQVGNPRHVLRLAGDDERSTRVALRGCT